MRETVTLSQREQARAQVLMLMAEGRCTTAEAATLLGLSERHVRRLQRAVRARGPAALGHGNRGQRPAHALPDALRTEVVRLAETVYRGYNHSHLHEVLTEQHALALSRRSVARILTAAGQRSPRRRRPPRHRSRRERMPRAGMLLQVDGSHHDWLEGRGPRLVLVGAVDDATGQLLSAVFREREDAHGYLLVLREAVRSYGVPLAWYSDRHSIFSRNDHEPWTLAEQLAGGREPTQVARALEQLGIQLILAHSPQAKGRVERCWGTLQDRLVKELRRAGACTAEEAERVLAAYLPRFRERFAVAPADPQPAYRPLPAGLDLDAVCSLHYVRTVAHDNTVRFEERLVQIPPGPGGRSYAGCRVQLQERLDGALAVVYREQVIALQPPSAPIAALRTRRRKRGRELAADILPPPPSSDPPQSTPPGKSPRKNTKPSSTHPWRRPVVRRTESLAD
jgi:transposase